MKICVIQVALVPEEYWSYLTEQFTHSYQQVLHPDTTIEVRGVSAMPAPDPANLHDYRNPYFELLLKTEVVKASLKAEEDGFDAVIVNCFDDPGVKEARGVVNIPVLGICEPSLHFVSQMGRKFAALVPDLPGQVEVVKQQIAEHGLTSHLLDDGVQKECVPYTESQPEASENPQPMADRLSGQAVELVRKGANAIIMACGGLGDNCFRAGVHSLEVDGEIVPVITPLLVSLKQTEAMLAMKKAYDFPGFSKAHDHKPLDAESKQRVHQGYGIA